MTVVEALTVAAEKGCWVRPVTWRGVCAGVIVEDGYLYSVPSARGRFLYNPLLKDLQAEWEVIPDAGRA